jgi:hypothetical protein
MWKQSLIIIKLLVIISWNVLKYFDMWRNVQHTARDDILTSVLSHGIVKYKSKGMLPVNWLQNKFKLNKLEVKNQD